MHRLTRICALSFGIILSQPHVLAQAKSPVTGGRFSKQEQVLLGSFEIDAVKQSTLLLTEPQFQGRGASQPGGEKAARLVAAEFRKIGLKPLGDAGSYLQKLDLRGYRVLPQTSVALNGAELEKDTDFAVLPFDMSRFPLSAHMHATGDLVFAGFGLNSDIPSRHDLDGISVRDKVVMIFEGLPDSAKLEEWAGVSTAEITARLAARVAAAVIIIGGKQFDKAILDLAARRGVALYDHSRRQTKALPILSITSIAARKVFEAAELNFEDTLKKADAGEYVSTELHKTASIDIELQFEKQAAGSFNVIGYVPGSDPQLAKESVIFTAHHDAYGIERDGKIFPGAGDDAVNVANLIEIARVVSRLGHPRRSIIFMAVTGEELWKLGSFYWVNQPTWPISKVAANLNMDGIGSESWGEMKNFYAIGIQQTDLARKIEDTARSFDAEVLPDTLKNSQLLQRSDAFEFARHGIPFVYGIGLPGDMSHVGAKFGPWLRDVTHYEADKIGTDWKWEGIRTYAEFFMVLGLRIADDQASPSWEPSSPFSRPRW